MSVTFYFMRHAETYLNKYERMQGWANAPLTEKGILDCIASGKGLAMTSFDAVYTSDLQRTKDTAKLIMAQNKVSKPMPFIEKSEFREVFFGSFEGLYAPEVWQSLRHYAKKEYDIDVLTRENQLNFLHEMDSTKDAEDYMTFWLRIEKGLYDLLEKHKETNDTILVVSHGFALNVMMQGIIPDDTYSSPLLNASVSKIIYENGQFHLEYVNSIDHFVY
ncbi:histidine phosphatase family protein [Carnobacteriaceae bacterium zg-ZUI78]|nr:histidine phosphatase family protein [Carnobacteriaceae bacterium zg-ZUI78]